MTDQSWSRRQFLTRSSLAAVAAAGAPALLAACSRTSTSSSSKTANAVDRVKKQGYVRVGFANEAPYGFADSAGKLTGEAPEVARAVFKNMGIADLQGVLTEFGSLIPGLQAGRFDIIAAGMFINAKRCSQILFSDPDYCAKTSFLVPAGNPKGITTFEAVAKNSGIRLGVLAGAVEGDYAKSLGVKGSQLKTFTDQPSGLDGLLAHRVDAFSLTSISLRNLASKRKGAKVEVTEPFVPVIAGKPQVGCGGYGFRKPDAALRDAFNAQLHSLMQGGQLLSIIQPFGFSQAEIADKTAAELCKA